MSAPLLAAGAPLAMRLSNAGSPPSERPAGVGFHVLESSPDRLVLDWQAGQYRRRSSPAGDVVELAGAEQAADGRPVAGVLVAYIPEPTWEFG